MRIARAILTILISAGLLIALNLKLGDIPPLGKFLDPFRGFWANAESLKTGSLDEVSPGGLQDEVTIRYDRSGVPHIFAKNNHDLYFAQGFVTARDRLWQMDFQTRFAAGRLSEVVGAKAIELDRYQRRMGMLYGAEKMVAEMEKDPVIMEVIRAYTAGINAYIKTLSPEDYPIEFKILNYSPEEWKPLNCALLLKLMSATLTGGSDEMYMSNVLSKFGPDVVNNLFPDFPHKEDPIIPSGTKWDFQALAIPKAPAEGVFAGEVRTRQKEDGIGSNNWAVSGKKSATGYPLLANDPHLDLTLPAIWYQTQLVSPDMNVNGVAIPGAPGIIIGFNKDVAWGVTNVGADVLDWYHIRFRDDSRKEYWYDNQWKPVQRRVEQITVRGGKTVTDTVLFTHHGPVVYLDGQKPGNFAKVRNIPAGKALKWIAHQPSNDVRTFYMLNRATDYAGYREALKYYTAPAQNFVFASVQNDIAITPNGYFPLKYKDQGKFILDGSEPANDWHGRIPAEQNPTVRNPERNFVSSANQSSTDTTYPYYINWEFSATERGRRINERLAVMNNATVDSMRNLQNDNYSVLARDLLPTLLGAVSIEGLNATEREALQVVRRWNKRYDAREIGASIFEIWQKQVIEDIWKDEFGDPGTPMRYPSRDRTVQLIVETPHARWFDDTSTPAVETMPVIVSKAFRFAVDSLTRRHGTLGANWQWAKVKASHVPHLAGIGGFGSRVLMNGGSKHSVNALGEKNGPSWRMVVALGPQLKAYGIFPGGQSGNPGSVFYDNMLDTWTNGKLQELLFMRSPDESPDQIISTLKLTR